MPALAARAAAPIPEMVAHLAEDGFVLWHRIGDREWVEPLRSACLRRARDIRTVLGGKPIGIGSAAGYIEIVQRSPGRWDVPISPKQLGMDDHALPWMPLVTAVLGDDAEPSFSGVVYSEPGSPAQHWHIDSPHESMEHRSAHALNVLLALHDTPMAMGPTECACGSHFLTNHLSNPRLVSDELVYQHQGTSPESLVRGTGHDVPKAFAEAMTAGSGLVFDDRLLHRGLANQSNTVRYMAYFSYRRKGYGTNTHFESQRSVYDPSP